MNAPAWLGTLLLASLGSMLSAGADQLAWNSLETCRAAVDRLPPGTVLVSYCSECDDEYVDVWLLKQALIAVTEDKRLYEVHVYCKRLFRSTRAFKKGRYAEPVEYAPVKPRRDDRSDLYVLKGIDLAYVYVLGEGDKYTCLGKTLGLPCDVTVAEIALPKKVAEAAGEEALHDPSARKGVLGPEEEERDLAAQEEAGKILLGLEAELPKKSGEELVAMLKERWRGDLKKNLVDYYRIRDGNKLIERELERRGEDIRGVLEAHRADFTGVFTGLGGDGRAVAHICRRLLEKIARPK